MFNPTQTVIEAFNRGAQNGTEKMWRPSVTTLLVSSRCDPSSTDGRMCGMRYPTRPIR